MHPAFSRTSFAAIVLAGTTSMTACSGGGASTPPQPVAANQGAASAVAPVGDAMPGAAAAPGVAAPLVRSASFALGFIPTDSATLGQLARIRHNLSLTPVPAAVDLSSKMPPVGDQGQEGSCVSWASAYALRGYEARRDVWSGIASLNTNPAYNFSPAFTYNQVNGGKDGGSTIPSVLSLMQQTGAATLADMPYVAGQFTTQPSAAAIANAAHYRLSSYGYIAPTDLGSMKVQLAAGLPVVLAIKVYNNFYTLGANAIYAAPGGGYAGGHAVTAVGYDDARQAVEVINSWGTSWGSAGYGWISYSALSQIALEAYSAVDDRGLPPPINAAAAPKATPIPKPAPKSTPKPKAAPHATPKPKPAPAPTPTS